MKTTNVSSKMHAYKKIFQRFWYLLTRIWSSLEGRLALCILGLWMTVALISLVWTPRSLWETDGYQVWQKPSSQYWLGTDGTGADVLSWLMAGSATNLTICLLTVMFAGAIGIVLIVATVSRSSFISNSSVVMVDAFIAIPTILIALILVVPLGASIMVVVVACGFGYGLNLARVARSQALLAANSDYTTAAFLSGAGSLRILLSHVLPNIAPTVAVQLSLSAGSSILAESGLTYLGIGVPSGTPSLGHSLATSVRLINVYPLTVLWPGLTVTIIVLALNLFGDALSDAVKWYSLPQSDRSAN